MSICRSLARTRGALTLFVLAPLAAASLAACDRGPSASPALPLSHEADGGAGAAVSCRSAELLDLAWEGIDEAGHARTTHLDALLAPCEGPSRLVVLQVGAGFCGTCRNAARHGDALLAGDLGARLRLADVLVRDDDGAPASASSAAGFRPFGTGARSTLADPDARVLALLPSRITLPAWILIDARTARVRDVVIGSDVSQVRAHAAKILAEDDGLPAPSPPDAPPLYDGRFASWQWEMILDMAIPGRPAPDATNAVGDAPEAAALGHALFEDTTLAPSGNIACTTCHNPDTTYADGLPQSTGAAVGTRNAPSIVLASHARWLFWDGRADSTWAQALGPIENAREMASSRLFVAHRIWDTHKDDYERIFGALPPLDDMGRFPATGKPGDAAWNAMTAGDRDATNRVFANVGKVIAAHERTLRALPNRLDRYIAGDASALDDAEKDGLRAFFDAGCAQCHYGPRLTDDAFHAQRFPDAVVLSAPDTGRAAGLALLAANEFSSSSPFSDAPTSPHAHDVAPPMIGAFKTPTLRGLPATAPYGHGGSLASIDDVVALYAKGGGGAAEHAAGTVEPWTVPFDNAAATAIAHFLRALDGVPSR